MILQQKMYVYQIILGIIGLIGLRLDGNSFQLLTDDVFATELFIVLANKN